LWDKASGHADILYRPWDGTKRWFESLCARRRQRTSAWTSWTCGAERATFGWLTTSGPRKRPRQPLRAAHFLKPPALPGDSYSFRKSTPARPPWLTASGGFADGGGFTTQHGRPASEGGHACPAGNVAAVRSGFSKTCRVNNRPSAPSRLPPPADNLLMIGPPGRARRCSPGA